MEINKLSEYIVTIDHFWNKSVCKRFIAMTEAIGYDPATVETDKGHQVVKEIRNNNRVMLTDQVLADSLWEKLRPVAPMRIGNSIATGLNELFRFYRYYPGQEFKRHSDQSFIRNDSEASYFTFMIYLNDDFEGGDTIFDQLTIKPKTGKALFFLHSLPHEGNAVRQGTKYVLRSDIMFKLEQEGQV